MPRVLSLAIAGLLGVVAANNVIAQTAPAGPRVRLQVVLDHFQGETKTGSVPLFFSLPLNEKGTLRVEADPASKDPCSPLFAAQTAAGLGGGTSLSGQFVGIQVDSTVVPTDDAFSVSLQFTQRSREGCQEVGGLWIPVFSNRIVAHVIRLRNGEPGEILLKGDSSRNESTKVTVTLTTIP